MYNNELGRRLSNQINDMNRKAVRHSNMELEGEGMTGGFLGTLASALLPSVVGSLGKMLGLGMSGGAQCMCDDMEGGAILNKLREKMMMEGYGKGSAEYKKMDESKFGCGTSGGASGMAEGTHMDTGFDKTDGAVEGGGFISDLGIPVVSGLAGMFGLGNKKGMNPKGKGKTGAGKSGGARKLTPYMELVMKVKKETGKSLKDSMKHIKQNGLYKK